MLTIKTGKHRFLSFALIWLFVALVVVPVVAHDLYLYEADVYGQAYIGRTQCSTLVYIYSTSYLAINCQPPYQLISLSTTTPETVINAAIAALTGGGRIVIANGTYTFTTTPINLGGGDVGAIGSTTINNIDLSGFGNSTILKAGTNMNGDIIITNNIQGWHIHDLQINGNAASQNGSGSSPPFAGIAFYHTSNSTIDHVYAHNNKAYGLYSFGGSDLQFLNNYLTWNYANGIIMESNSSLIANNLVDGASDIGISITGTFSANHYVVNDIVQNNIITNINLGISPFGSQSGIGISIGDGGLASGITVSGNTIRTTSGAGIVVGGTSAPDFDISVTGNLDTNSYQGIRASLVTRLIVNDNMFNSTTRTAAIAGVIYILTNVVDSQFENNLVYTYPNLWVQGIYWSSASPGLISGNNLIMTCPSINGGHICIGLQQAATVSGMQIVGNTFNCLAGGSDGISDTGAMSYSLISNNYFLGNSSSVVQPDPWIITGTYNLFSGNFVYNWNGGDGYDAGTHNAYRDNQGYGNYMNFPVGYIASPFVSSGNYILDSGGTATPTNATTYTVWESPKLIIVATTALFPTHELSIYIDGTKITTATPPPLDTIYTFTLQPGETILVDYPSAGVTFYVSGQ